MKFTSAQNLTSFAELLRWYGDADEIVFKSHCHLDAQEIVELCREARRVARHLRLHHGPKSAAEIAQAYGIAVIRDSWRTAAGKIIFLAECHAHPPTIRLNVDAIRMLAEMAPHWANEEELVWFTEARVTEVATAHELYHLIEPPKSSPSVELAAHVFARAFTALPFSPLIYHALLIRLTKSKGAGRE
jgi:hypothetical protein